MTNNSKKNIKILLCFESLNINGASKMFLLLAKILKKENYKVEAFSPKKSDLYKELNKLNIQTTFINNFESESNFKNYLQNFNCIIINTIRLYSIIYKYRNTLPIIWYLHEYKSIEYLYERNIPKLRECLISANNLVVIGEQIQEFLAYAYNIKWPTVIYNVIESSVNSNVNTYSNSNLNITCIGTIFYRKGQDLLLYVNHNYLDHSKFHINIAGHVISKNNNYYKKSIEPYLDSNVSLLGYVNGKEKDKLYRQTNILVVPSLDEPFGLVILEALSYGIPVIAANTLGCPSVINKKCGWLFNQKNPIELAKILNDIQSRKYNLRQYSRAAKKHFKKFNNIKQFKKSWINIIYECADKINVHNYHKCTNCKSCVIACSKTAISLKKNSDNLWYPFVDRKQCDFCGICVKACPEINKKNCNHINSTNIKNEIFFQKSIVNSNKNIHTKSKKNNNKLLSWRKHDK